MCSFGCNNTLGSFYCYCNEGYMLDSDDRTCVGMYCNINMLFHVLFRLGGLHGFVHNQYKVNLITIRENNFHYNEERSIS